MRRLLYLLFFLAALTSHVSAQFTSDGFYRVQNFGTKRYLYLTDCTGYYDMNRDIGDFGALQMFTGKDKTVSDAASIIYIKKYGSQVDIQGQGIGIYKIVSRYVDLNYISSGANWIVAEPMTLTGSIGIFGMFPIAKELINDKIGVHYSTVKTNELSDFGDFSREMTESEKNLLQRYVNRGYELFTKRCADGRKVSQDSIKAIGEGRVWTGEHAKKIGLVDELGGLSKAIEKAKQLAKIDDYTLMSYPAKKSFLDGLLENVSAESYASAKMEDLLGEYYGMFNTLRHLNPKGNVQAEMPFKITFNL